MPRNLCLALHAAYQCRHTGRCCSSDWVIPAEPHVLHVVSSRGIMPICGSVTAFVAEGGETDPVLARRDDDTCVFYDRDGSRLCEIHRIAGPDALPSACRHFPRVFLLDRRGIRLSLSHFCPTAARLLLTSDPAVALAIVDAQPPLRLDAGIDGLDALEALPPLVRPGLISDLEGYDAWETASLAVLAQPGLTSRQALDAIAAATEDVREWKPGAESLSARVVLAFGRTTMPSPPPDVRATFIDVAAHCFPVPAGPVDRFDDVWARMVAPRIGAFEPAIRNYLAARLFGNWIAYQGRGWRTIVAWLRTSLGVLENELARRCGASGQPLTADDVIAAFAAADRLLVHTVDSDVLGRHFAPAEGPEPR